MLWIIAEIFIELPRNSRLAEQNDCDCRIFFISLFFSLRTELSRFYEIFFSARRALPFKWSYYCAFALWKTSGCHAIATTLTLPTVSLVRAPNDGEEKNYLPYLSPLKIRIVIVDVCYKHYTIFRAPHDSSTRLDSTPVNVSEGKKRRNGGAASKHRIKNFVSNRNDNRASRKQRIYNCFRKKRENCHVSWIRMFSWVRGTGNLSETLFYCFCVSSSPSPVTTAWDFHPEYKFFFFLVKVSVFPLCVIKRFGGAI
jgi:hypothetical protein